MFILIQWPHQLMALFHQAPSYYHTNSHDTRGEWVNPLWSSNAIWWHRFEAILVEVMACCLTALSHYLNQCWLFTSKYNDIHLGVISEQIPQQSITNLSLKTTYLKLNSNPPGANELKPNHLLYFETACKIKSKFNFCLKTQAQYLAHIIKAVSKGMSIFSPFRIDRIDIHKENAFAKIWIASI